MSYFDSDLEIKSVCIKKLPSGETIECMEYVLHGEDNLESRTSFISLDKRWIFPSATPPLKGELNWYAVHLCENKFNEYIVVNSGYRGRVVVDERVLSALDSLLLERYLLK